MNRPRRATIDSTNLRVGAVSYLNTKPLVYGLDAGRSGIVLSYDYPSRLADQLSDGAIDVGLIPSIAYLRDPSYTIVSDACIACQGAVLSVKLLSRLPFPRIRRLALDTGSQTSAVLARLLLWERYRIRPELSSLPLGSAPESAEADAVLVIGDRAIHASQEVFAHVWDLGEQWYRWAALPFVFAMWVARPGVDVPFIADALSRARDAGLENLQAIAEVNAARVGLTVAETRDYLANNLHFRLGRRERQGLDEYFRRAANLFQTATQQEYQQNDCTTA